MSNNRKESWLLKSPNLVPRNSKLRLCMFIIINLILSSLFPILAIFINFPYGYLCWFLVLCIGALFNIKAFHIHAERFPLNSYLEYQFDPLKDLIGLTNGVFVIEIERKLNIFTVKLRNKILVMDMKGCIFPLTIIRAYLGRQFIIECINKFKLVSDTMRKNIDISKLFKDYTNIKIIYINKHKIRTMFLVKNRKTKMNLLMKSINGYGYVAWYYIYHGINKYFAKITEQEFIERKEYYRK